MKPKNWGYFSWLFETCSEFVDPKSEAASVSDGGRRVFELFQKIFYCPRRRKDQDQLLWVFSMLTLSFGNMLSFLCVFVVYYLESLLIEMDFYEIGLESVQYWSIKFVLSKRGGQFQYRMKAMCTARHICCGVT